MAKLTKSALKGIVKECLIEILSEGIGSSETITESRRPARKKVTQRKKPSAQVINDDLFESAVNKTVNSITDDSIMKDIFADTARTTLQEQNKNDTSARVSGGSPSSLSTANAGIDLDGLFDSASENWSSLAFSEKKKSERNN